MTSLVRVLVAAVALTGFGNLPLDARATRLPADAPAFPMPPAWGRGYRTRCEPYEGDPARWLSQAPANLDGEQMMARFSHCTWAVSTGAQDAVVAKLDVPRTKTVDLPFEPSVTPRWRMARCAGDAAEYSAPPLSVRDFLAVPGGFLVGYNSGEFGGGLARFDAKGRFVDEITSENVVRILAEDHGAIVFTGIAHLTRDMGHVLRLSQRTGRWRETRAALPGHPRAMLAESDGSYLVVTSHHLVRVTQNLRVVVLHRGAWGGNVAPTSIVQDSSGTVYIGMRYAVARLRATGHGYSEEWLVPPGPQSPGARDAG